MFFKPALAGLCRDVSGSSGSLEQCRRGGTLSVRMIGTLFWKDFELRDKFRCSRGRGELDDILHAGSRQS